MRWTRLVAILLILLPIAAEAQEAELRPAVSTVKLADNLFELTAVYGNPIGSKLLALTGPEGTVLVDSGYPQTAEIALPELGKLASGKVRYLINTHVHDDHAGGNAVLGAGATVIAHDNVRSRMTGGLARLAPPPAAAIPTLTFDHSLTLHVNGEEVRLLYLPNAHTDGDIVVHLVRSGVVAVGDLVFPDRFPYVALRLGGDVQRCLDTLLALATMFPEGTRFVAAHGPIYGAAQLRAYHGELVAMRELVRQGLAAGKTADQLKAEKVLERWAAWGTSFVTAERFLDTLVAAERGPAQATRPSVVDRLVPALVAADGEAAVVLYRKLKAESPDAFAFDEVEINQLGYVLLQGQRTADAIAIFRLNVAEHPDSWNAYDSLGEGLMVGGQKELAIANYEKSLELNPANTNAVQMLERLRKQ